MLSIWYTAYMNNLNMDSNESCDLTPKSKVPAKKMEVVDGLTVKYHANGTTIWSKGRMVDDQPDGYWEWYRPDGTLKRSGHFEVGQPVGEWITYDRKGEKYKVTQR